MTSKDGLVIEAAAGGLLLYETFALANLGTENNKLDISRDGRRWEASGGLGCGHPLWGGSECLTLDTVDT